MPKASLRERIAYLPGKKRFAIEEPVRYALGLSS
jgi:hypothetical protein